MDKMGIPTDQLKTMRDQFLGGSAGADATAGVGGLMAALGGGLAGGAVQTSGMIDAITGTSVATDAMEANAKLMIRAMIQAARADGDIDAEERAKIFDHLGEIGDEERAFIESELEAPVNPTSLALDTSEQMAAQVYAAALMTVRVDTLSEADYLNTLADALNLSQDARDRIHNAMGVS